MPGQIPLSNRPRCWFRTPLEIYIITLIVLVATGLLAGQEPPGGRPVPKVYQKPLSFEKLVGASMPGADLRNTEMTMTDFQKADLSGSDFTGSKMDRAKLDGANLSKAVGLGTVDFGLGIDAQRANFQGADLRNARIPGQYFEEADFRGADLRGAFLHGRFHGARFEDADVRDAVLLGCSGINSLHDGLRRRGAIVNADDFARAVRQGRDFAGRDFHGAGLAGINLDSARIPRASFHSAELEGASLRQCDFKGAEFCYAKLRGATLNGADFTDAKLGGADLTGADLAGAKFPNAEFWRARLQHANLAGADLTNADFRHADLTGADLSGATLTGAQWDGAIIADLRGVTVEEEAALKSQAGRWKHDLAEWFNHSVRDYSVLVWLLTLSSGAVVLYRGRRRTPGHASFKLLTWLHLFALLPAFAFLFICVSGASPVAQLSGNLGGWSAWVRTWPLAFGLSALALAAFVPVALIAWVLAFRKPAPGLRSYLAAATILTGLSLAATLGTLIQLTPSA